MSFKSGGASFLGGGIKGAATGAAIGSAVPIVGTGIGALAGGLLGGFGSLLGDSADQDALENDPEYQAMKRRERGLSMFRANVGRAMKARRQPATFQEALNGPA